MTPQGSTPTGSGKADAPQPVAVVIRSPLIVHSAIFTLPRPGDEPALQVRPIPGKEHDDDGR